MPGLTHFLALGPGCWGRGTDRRTAVNAMRRRWPVFATSGYYRVFKVSAAHGVDEQGRLVGPARPAPLLVAEGEVFNRRSMRRAGY